MLLLFAIAVAPVALLMIYIYNRDHIQKEPVKQLLKAFFIGGLGSCIFTFIYSELLDFQAETWEGAFESAFGQSVLEAAIPEEIGKYLFLYWLIWKNPAFDERFDGILYATFISLGFACFENILYVMDGGIGTGIMRALTSVPGHFFFGVIMGYYFSKAKFTTSRFSNQFKALFFAIIAHGVYDFILFYSECLDKLQTEDTDYALATCGLLVSFFVFNIFLWKRGLKKIQALREEDGAPAKAAH